MIHAKYWYAIIMIVLAIVVHDQKAKDLFENRICNNTLKFHMLFYLELNFDLADIEKSS